MRTSLVVLSFGAALTALASAISPSQAEPVSHAYPYCLLGRGGGSTTCYFRSLAECGSGCIDNPAYVGEARARAILAGAGVAGGGGAFAKAAGARNTSRITRSTRANVPRMVPPVDPGARASERPEDGFAGWPTGYIIDRFGDHQAQGRF